VKIQEIRCVQVQVPERRVQAKPIRPPWSEDAEVANPMSRFPRYKRHRSLWLPDRWGTVWVQVIAEDGTWGLGMTSFGRPVQAIIEDHLAPRLIGEDCLAVEKCWDMMFCMTKPYGTVGIASAAISGVDLALWDLAGKLLQRPVYELLGGPVRNRIFAYATGNDVDWQKEIGFRAVKLACPYGPADGMHGLEENERLVAEAREAVGEEVEVMLDCYMAFDVEYIVRLAERLRPYRLKWIEEYLIPEDLEGHLRVRERLPWQTLATGEHMYTPYPFAFLARHQAVDILQPDIFWVGGLTACRKICALAEAAGLIVILHGGGLSQYGLHLTAAMPNTPWAEYWGPPPGMSLEDVTTPWGPAVVKESYLWPAPGNGFGLQIEADWITPHPGGERYQ
jgi:L-rhamnonate dehydratase